VNRKTRSAAENGVGARNVADVAAGGDFRLRDGGYPVARLLREFARPQRADDGFAVT
jgi:hypothetical protein